MPDIIKLPSERVEQLRTLAKNLDMSIADCIGMFVNEQIDKGNLEPDVPGFKIFATKGGKKFHFGTDEFRKIMGPSSADSFIKTMREITRPSKNNPFMPLPEGLKFARRGTSLKITDTDTGATKTVAFSIAKDLGRQMERISKS